MANLAVIGAQWGDEGKGKIVDLLCEKFDVVARYQGGHNAGHTVKFADKHFALRLIPSGILHPGKLCLLGNGMVIEPAALMEEIASLQELGVPIGDNLRISDGAHVILPYHKEIDLAREHAAGTAKIGTTGRGIGPAYEAKIARQGVRVADLRDAAVLQKKVEAACSEKSPLLETVYGGERLDASRIVEQCLAFGEQIASRIVNGPLLVHRQIREGKAVMFEGAQGTMLDVDHGTYPYVTSSNTVIGGVCTGLGVAPKHIHRVLGVVKAYTTRVGGGSFPTELHDEHGEHLRRRGNEFGTVTGRPRRTGWLDLAILRTSAMVNGLDELAVTKLDVLDQFAEIPVCTGYRIRGEVWKTFPSFAVGDFEPQFRVFKGWNRSTAGVTSFEDLPQEARDYLRFLEDEVEAPASIVSTGPRREETIVRG